jgi:hypothetical protein
MTAVQKRARLAYETGKMTHRHEAIVNYVRRCAETGTTIGQPVRILDTRV